MFKTDNQILNEHIDNLTKLNGYSIEKKEIDVLAIITDHIIAKKQFDNLPDNSEYENGALEAAEIIYRILCVQCEITCSNE